MKPGPPQERVIRRMRKQKDLFLAIKIGKELRKGKRREEKEYHRRVRIFPNRKEE